MRQQAGALPNPEFQFQNENLRPGQTYSRDVDTLAYVVQPLDVLGKRSRRIDAAQQTVTRTQAEYELAQLLTVRDVKLAYWRARGAQESRDLLKSTVANFQQIERVKERIASMRLPPGVQIIPFYDQSYVIDGTIHTVEKNLFEGFILVTVLLLVFLGNVRAAIITATVIPLSMLISFLGMRAFGISANLMSLGAIDFGMIVDGAIVMMENSVHRLEKQHGDEPPLESVRRAAHEVVRPMTFAVVIIIAVYLPILFLQGLEGRMFRPMAITVCAALFGSLLLALTFVPVLASFSFRHGIPPRVAERHERWMTAMNARYRAILTWTLAHRFVTVGTAVVILAVAIGSLFFIGTEFMPRLDEGDILVETKKLPGVSLTDSVAISKRIEERLRKFPEIDDVVIKSGGLTSRPRRWASTKVTRT